MLNRDILKISTRSFRNNQLRTFLTILGIGIGIGSIYFLISLGYGFQKLILEKIATSDSLLALDITQKSETVEINEEAVKQISQISDIVEVIPVISQETQIGNQNFITDAKVNIIKPNFFSLEAIQVDQGELFRDDDLDKIVISSAALRLLNLNEGDFNQEAININIHEIDKDGNVKNHKKSFYIKGVIKDETQVFVYVPIDSLSEISFSNFDKVKVKVASDDKIEKVREEIITKGFFVSAVSDLVEQAKQIFKAAQFALALFGVIALVVSAIGMFNTMTIALLERTQEIGIMKTLGASSFDIWKMFLSESILISFSGGLLGIILGYIGGWAINIGINVLAKNFGGVEVTLFYTPVWFILFILIFSVLIGLITGFYPAKRAAKLNALDALRYK